MFEVVRNLSEYPFPAVRAYSDRVFPVDCAVVSIQTGQMNFPARNTSETIIEACPTIVIHAGL
jgi:hypothetical protein